MGEEGLVEYLLVTALKVEAELKVERMGKKAQLRRAEVEIAPDLDIGNLQQWPALHWFGRVESGSVGWRATNADAGS